MLYFRSCDEKTRSFDLTVVFWKIKIADQRKPGFNAAQAEKKERKNLTKWRERHERYFYETVT